MKRPNEGPEKPTWASVPAPVKSAVENQLQDRITSGRRVWGGYTPSGTFKLKLEGGGSAFFKGVGRAGNDHMRAAIRAEMRVYRELPAIQPWAPSLLGSITVDDWDILLLEYIPNTHRAPPWTKSKARATVETLARFHNSFTGIELPDWLRRGTEMLFGPDHDAKEGWRSFKGNASAITRLAGFSGRASGEAREWLEQHTPRLMDLEAGILSIGGPETLLHMDVRSDNLLFPDDGSVVFADWPYAGLGRGLLDAVAFIQSATTEGGPSPDEMLSWYDAVSDHPLDSKELVATVVGVSGYFASRGHQPAIPGLPTVRSMQRAQLVTSLRWAARLVDLPAPTWLSELRLR